MNQIPDFPHRVPVRQGSKTIVCPRRPTPNHTDTHKDADLLGIQYIQARGSRGRRQAGWQREAGKQRARGRGRSREEGGSKGSTPKHPQIYMFLHWYPKPSNQHVAKYYFKLRLSLQIVVRAPRRCTEQCYPVCFIARAPFRSTCSPFRSARAISL